jgi:hypothetical protein
MAKDNVLVSIGLMRRLRALGDPQRPRHTDLASMPAAMGAKV